MSTIYDFYSADAVSLLDNRKKVIIPQVSPSVVEEYKTFSNAVSSNEYQYSMLGITGMGMGQIIADGQVPSSDAPIQGFAKTFTQYIFTERIRLSQQETFYMIKNGDGAKLDKTIADQVTNIKNSIVHLKNYIAQTMIANGWSTSVSFTPIGGTTATTLDTTGADGVAFFSASHPREDGGTAWSNVIVSGTTNPTFSLTALIAARAQHSLKKDGRGLPLLGSKLGTFMFLENSTAYTLAQSISKTLAAGKYPSALPGGSATVTSSTSSPVDGNPTDGFEVVGLTNYGGTGVTSAMWFGVDKNMMNDKYGLQYVKSMDLMVSPFVVDQVGNMDYISTATEYATFGGADFRYWEVSNGTNA